MYSPRRVSAIGLPVVLRWRYHLALHLPAHIHRRLHLVHLFSRRRSCRSRRCRVVHVVHATRTVASAIRPAHIAIEYCNHKRWLRT